MNDVERLQETLRVMAEAQRALVTGREGSGRRLKCRYSKTIRTFVGTAKTIQTLEKVGLSDSEVASLIVGNEGKFNGRSGHP